ncbi:MAG: TRAP transporter small permease subunit [Paracoccaceae bacterium]|nr:TRAP transporter small permease subunit [Paracoccaceae bacterium]MDE2911942.1 TRAP transporter small permease subunit [Paracoccaceae bacterium]
MLSVLSPVAWANTRILRIGRQLAWIALALMVLVTLAQVFFRYVLNSALAWPDEAARFLMLWMIAFIAPSAMRWGGFVSIDMLPRALPRVPSLILGIALLGLSLAVLMTAAGHGYNHTFGFGGKFDSSSLRVPLEWIGLETVKVKLRYMYGSLLVCVVLLTMVTVELILRMLVMLANPEAELPSDDASGARFGAE